MSTGSGTALGFLPYLAARGVSAHYVECATRVESPSLTGNLLGAVPGVHRYTQWEHQAHGRWHYGGSVFDGFAGVTKTEPGPIRRAVVSVGTMPDFAFRSLFEALAPLLRAGGAIERAQGSPVETLWQTGCTPVDDLGIPASPFVPGAELEAAIAGADLVVSHAGTGSSLTASDRRTVPRARSPSRRRGRDRRRSPRRVRPRARSARDRDAPRAAELTADDLLLASTRYVKRSSQPEPFKLID